MTITLTKVARLGPCDVEFTVDWDGAPERYAFRCDSGDPMTPISWNRPLERELAEEFEALRGLNKVAGRVCREEEITLPLELGMPIGEPQGAGISHRSEVCGDSLRPKPPPDPGRLSGR